MKVTMIPKLRFANTAFDRATPVFAQEIAITVAHDDRIVFAKTYTDFATAYAVFEALIVVLQEGEGNGP